MSDSEDVVSQGLERVPSGLPGLDTILGGGFLRGGVYMVLAQPGSGKTILGNQICFRHVAGGGRALVVTLLTESHSRLIGQLRTLSFFDQSCIGATLSYVTGYQALEKGKLKGLLALLRQIVRDHKATFLMIDGLVTAGSMAESEVEVKKFIHELQVFVELMGCTTLLLTGISSTSDQYALRTMVDGLMELHLDSVGMAASRSMEVRKFRGGGVLMGRHLFEITNDGITVFPRVESHYGQAPDRADLSHTGLSSFRIPGLDAMLAGGLRAGSVSMILGAPGSGKTLLGLSLLAAGAKAKEPSLYFGFFETPKELCRKADGIGLSLSKHVSSGVLDLEWHSPIAGISDALAEKVLTTVRSHGIKRLFMDGVGGFKETLVYHERRAQFFGALCNELRSLSVVTVLSDETRDLRDLQIADHGLMSMFDNVFFLRHLERNARVYKLLSMSKMREGNGDCSVHEFSIGSDGFVVSPDAESAAAIVSGEGQRTAQQKPRSPAARKGRKRRAR